MRHRRSKHHGPAGSALAERAARSAETPCPAKPAAFASDDDLLAAALRMFRARQAIAQAEQEEVPDAKKRRALAKTAAAWARYWHASRRRCGPAVALARECRRRRLNQTECEILTVLVLDQLELLNGRIRCCSDVVTALRIPAGKELGVMRMLSEHGRLCRAGLLGYEDPEEALSRRTPVADPGLVDAVLAKRGTASKGWQVASETELYDRLAVLTRTLSRKSEAIHYGRHAINGSAFTWIRKTDRLLDELDETLKQHADWKLAGLLKQLRMGRERLIVLALLGKELGHLGADDDLFNGGGLARAVSDHAEGSESHVRLLTSDRRLVRDGYVQPCGGPGEVASNDSTELARTEFELTEKTATFLGLDKRTSKHRSGEFTARQPMVRLEHLVLAPPVRRAVDMAIVHARHSRRMLDDWGLGELVPYGRGSVLLFSGPPGTGKTATAEALAGELGRPILVADYSRIQNCFVGQTEKNIVRAFRAAKGQEAVLFWDEADAMFYDRDSARYNWEVRDVNVLLQELEHFDGVCILATNRKITLDKALERRIALKVEFARPGRGERRQIWQRLLPKKLPLGSDVDLDELSELDLVGGEIKNVVLNAARLALQRHNRGPVTMPDFREALAMERDGRWNEGGKRIGFVR